MTALKGFSAGRRKDALGTSALPFLQMSYAAAVCGRLTSGCRLAPFRPLHHSTIGEAMKMDEYVPTMMPIKIANAKSRSTGPPKKNSDATDKNVQPLVSSVRLSVSLIEAFMMS